MRFITDKIVEESPVVIELGEPGRAGSVAVNAWRDSGKPRRTLRLALFDGHGSTLFVNEGELKELGVTLVVRRREGTPDVTFKA